VRSRLHSLVAEASPQIATDLLQPLLELLLLARSFSGGDVDKFLVLLVVALRTTGHPEFGAATTDELTRVSTAALPGLGTNGRSIAESLSIPKETVRRKLGELIEAGWVVRQEAQLFLTPTAWRDLAPVRQELEGLAVRYFELVARVQGEAKR
jgi:hypothetical protein